MFSVWGTLAQLSVSASTLTDIYTPGQGKHSTVEVIVCNRGADTTVRLSYAIAGAADSIAQYLLYDVPLGANSTISTVRFTVNATDVLRVYAASGDVSFTVNGIEEEQ